MPVEWRQGLTRKRMGLVLAIGLAALYLFFFVGSLYEALRFPRAPQAVTLVQAVSMARQNEPDFLVFDQTQYITITDAVWECASIRQTGYQTIFRDRRWTDAVFTDAQRTAIVFARVHGFYSCDELRAYHLMGELQPVDDGRPVQYQSDTAGMVQISAESGAIFFFSIRSPTDATFLPIGCALLPLVVWAVVQSQKKN